MSRSILANVCVGNGVNPWDLWRLNGLPEQATRMANGAQSWIWWSDWYIDDGLIPCKGSIGLNFRPAWED